MKKWTKLFAVLALAVMLLLTACDDGTTGGGSGGTSGGNWGNGGGNTTGGGTGNTTTDEEDDKPTTSSSVFLTALNKLISCQTHLMAGTLSWMISMAMADRKRMCLPSTVRRPVVQYFGFLC